MKIFVNWFQQKVGAADSSGFLSAITGGSFENMSILALNITPYITSSIIMQLLTIAIPKLEEMQKDGEDGRKKIVAITRYVTVGLALIESAAMAFAFWNGGMLDSKNALNVITIIATLTAGSAFLMWVGEQNHGDTESEMVFPSYLVINIISRIPQDISSVCLRLLYLLKGKPIAVRVVAALVIIAVIVAVVVLVIILNGGTRKIPVQYAKKIQGRKTVGGQSSCIPLKVNTSGVIPIIFASSLMQLPVVICSFFGNSGNRFLGTCASWIKLQ